MRRLLACLASMSLVILAPGCAKNYEARLEKTYANLKYQQRLDKFLGKAEQGDFKEDSIYLRPPKPLETSKESLGDKEMFDVVQSFFDPSKGANGLRLHVLARVKKAKKATKKGQPPPPEPANRGAFQADLLNLLASSYSAAETLASPAWKDDTLGPRKNKYKRLIFTNPSNSNTVKVYVVKQDPYDVALVWDIPASLTKGEASVDTGINLCLEAFAVGAKAKQLFDTGGEEESGPVPGGGGGGGVPVF